MKSASTAFAVTWASIFILLQGTPALGGIDTPGYVQFSFSAETNSGAPACSDLHQVQAQDLDQTSTTAYFSSDASRYGDDGVFIWLTFELEGPDGLRNGMLLLDLDLDRAPLDDQTPLPPHAVRADYIEKSGDTILFDGRLDSGQVWIVDVIFHDDDKGAVEGDFALIFKDPDGRNEGCRILTLGTFLTDPSPSELYSSWGLSPADQSDGEHVSVDCGGAVYYADDGSGCGGGDSGSSGCEGDTSSDAGGCGGDDDEYSDEGSDCEGSDDSSTTSDDGGGSCEGDTSGDDEGACSVAPSRYRSDRIRGRPLRAVQRFLPELTALWFIFWLRRRLH